MIAIETPRLRLRDLNEDDLPRLTDLISDWEVARWLAVVPHPYRLADAEEFYAGLQMVRPLWRRIFAIAAKTDNALLGVVGLHPARVADPKPDEIVLGYWLGKPSWGRGLMTEAVVPMLALAFAQPQIAVVTATTDPENYASQNVLRKNRLRCLGLQPRLEPSLRGGAKVLAWEIQRTEHIAAAADTMPS
jgi:8-oxo-dGTP diphosphatase